MTNPNNAIGTNAAYSGRTSVNAFNDDLAAYSRGILTGWNCQVDTGLTVILGGGHSARDVAIAEDNAGNKTTINNISLDEVPVTLDTAPGANSRIDAIVAYVDNPPQGSDSTADNPEACGIIPVAGTPAVDPQAPDDNAIRTAITADGASGTTAYYVVLATVTIPTGTTDLIPGYIEQGDKAALNTNQIADNSITSPKIDFTSFGGMLDMVRITDNKSIGNSFVDYGSTTITKTGLYFITLYCSGGSAGSTEIRTNIRALRNGAELFACGAWSVKNYAGNNFAEASMSECYWLEEGDVIKVQLKNQNWTGQAFGQMDVKCIY